MKTGTSMSSIIVAKKKKKKVQCCVHCINGSVTARKKEVYCKYYKQFKPMLQDRQLKCFVKKA